MSGHKTRVAEAMLVIVDIKKYNIAVQHSDIKDTVYSTFALSARRRHYYCYTRLWKSGTVTNPEAVLLAASKR